MPKKERAYEDLLEELREAECSPWDGKSRLVDDSSKVQADGFTWGIVSDHGNVELCHKGRNGRVYYHGGLV